MPKAGPNVFVTAGFMYSKSGVVFAPFCFLDLRTDDKTKLTAVA